MILSGRCASGRDDFYLGAGSQDVMIPSGRLAYGCDDSIWLLGIWM